MGIGVASGENRATEAAQQAIGSPLLETSINGASGILLNIKGSSDVALQEANEAAQVVAEVAADDANIIFGTVVDETLADSIVVTVIATGFDRGADMQRRAGRRQEARLDTPDFIND